MVPEPSPECKRAAARILRSRHGRRRGSDFGSTPSMTGSENKTMKMSKRLTERKEMRETHTSIKSMQNRDFIRAVEIPRSPNTQFRSSMDEVFQYNDCVKM